MKIDPKEITKVFEELDSDYCCQGTGFCPSGIKMSGMKAGEEPKLVFAFKRCIKGCEENTERFKEIFFL